jgi:hypothetical protein
MDSCARTVRAARDERDFAELHWLKACAGIINDVVEQRYREIDPSAVVGTPFPEDLEVTPEMLLLMDATIQAMIDEEAIGMAFSQILPPEECGIFVAFCGIIYEYGNDRKGCIEAVRANITPLVRQGSILFPVLEALLAGKSPALVLKTQLDQRGIRVAPSEKSPGVIAFLAHFRSLVARSLGESGLGSYALPAPESTLAPN